MQVGASNATDAYNMSELKQWNDQYGASAPLKSFY